MSRKKYVREANVAKQRDPEPRDPPEELDRSALDDRKRLGFPRHQRRFGSSSHSREQDEPDRAKDGAWNPRRDIRRNHSLAADGLRELNHHQKDDRRGKAHADAVRGAAALRARGKRRAEQRDDDARDRHGDLERPLDPQLVRVASRALERAMYREISR